LTGAAAAEPIAPPNEDRQLEQSLILAMSRAPGTTERLYNSDVPILGYAKHGFIPLKPDAREDYVDYRRFRRRAHLLDATLVAIEEEYQTKYIGCCVNAGVGAVVKLEGGLDKLKRFAADNACSIEEDRQRVAERLEAAKAKVEPAARYLSISCRERDAPSEKLVATRGRENRFAKVICVGALKEAGGGKMAELGDECRLPPGSAALSRLREACGAASCVVEASAIVNPKGPLMIEKVEFVRRVEGKGRH